MNNTRIKFLKLGQIALMGAVFFALLVLCTPSTTQAQYYNYDPYGYNYSNLLNVTTGSASFVTKSTATLNGFVNVSSASTYISTWFEYGTQPSYGYSTVHVNSTGYPNFSGTIGSLSPSTTYYFRAVVQNASGMVFYGNSNSFRTNADYPFDGGQYQYPNNPIPQTLTAITRSATNVGSRNVNLNSLVVNTPDVPSSTWFEWGTDLSLGNRTPVVSIGTVASVKHISTITKLKPSTVYYFRAVVENPYTRNNGNILSFTTRYAAPTTVLEQPEPVVEPKDTIEETTITADDLKASAIGAGSFLPSSFFEWTILLILVLVLIMLSRYVFVKN